jgi:hypothetical protein
LQHACKKNLRPYPSVHDFIKNNGKKLISAFGFSRLYIPGKLLRAFNCLGYQQSMAFVTACSALNKL